VLPTSLYELPEGLPEPHDDGAANHLVGMQMPSVALPSTNGSLVDVGRPSEKRLAVYCYPMTGVPGTPLPTGWDEIPGARGCKPQAASFQQHAAALRALQCGVYGVSTQSTAVQSEVVERMHLTFELLSDAELKLTRALRLPTFEVDGKTLIKRLTMIVRSGRIEHVFYPIFPPGRNVTDVLDWLATHPLVA